jgi:hypothetical protein
MAALSAKYRLVLPFVIASMLPIPENHAYNAKDQNEKTIKQQAPTPVLLQSHAVLKEIITRGFLGTCQQGAHHACAGTLQIQPQINIINAKKGIETHYPVEKRGFQHKPNAPTRELSQYDQSWKCLHLPKLERRISVPSDKYGKLR